MQPHRTQRLTHLHAPNSSLRVAATTASRGRRGAWRGGRSTELAPAITTLGSLCPHSYLRVWPRLLRPRRCRQSCAIWSLPACHCRLHWWTSLRRLLMCFVDHRPVSTAPPLAWPDPAATYPAFRSIARHCRRRRDDGFGLLLPGCGRWSTYVRARHAVLAAGSALAAASSASSTRGWRPRAAVDSRRGHAP